MDLVEYMTAAAAVGRLGLFRHHVAGEIGERRDDLGAAEIDAEREGRVARHLVAERRAADGAAGAPGGPRPALALERRHHLRHGLL